ncbi:MAG: RHS repeat-associated core domain-containing protein [Vicinamibacteria bacterium]
MLSTSAVSKGGTLEARFEYDPLGRRVVKATPTRVTSYTYDGSGILRERIAADGTASVSPYVHGPSLDEPMSKEANGTITYYHADGLGSIVKETNASGDVTTTLRYDAWGNIEAGERDGFAFTGREWDPETGLYYYRARYYEPKSGRFISEDPVRLGGGVNFYAYVPNAPSNWTDPLGLKVNINLLVEGEKQPARDDPNHMVNPWQVAQDFVPVNGRYTVAGHGERSFYFSPIEKIQGLTVEELAKRIRKDPDWHGQLIELLARETASKNSSEDSYAQRLADTLQTKVIAYTTVDIDDRRRMGMACEASTSTLRSTLDAVDNRTGLVS